MSRTTRSRNLPKLRRPPGERSKAPLIVALAVAGGVVVAALAAMLLTSDDSAIVEPAARHRLQSSPAATRCRRCPRIVGAANAWSTASG